MTPRSTRAGAGSVASTVLISLTVLGALLPSPGVAGQEGLTPGDTVLVTPRGRYPAGPFHRWVLGNGHRELWATPVPAPVLDLARFAGGLTPLRMGGGQQTRSLRLQGADGVVYNFRSIDKDASRTLDPVLRTTLAADILQDQIASLFPLSSMVVAPLLDAAGVFHPQPRLVVLPDSPQLGEFQDEFAGLLGWLEIRPDEGAIGTVFAESDRVVSTPRLFERIEEGSDDIVDQENFLRARLMDFLVGDWDRHPDQWRWIGFEREVAGRETTVFEPIPRDRDWAMARLDGAFTTFSWIPWPQYSGFSAELPRVFRISWNGRGLDRRYLNALDRERFLTIAAELQADLTDEVIRSAVRQLPDSYYDQVGADFEHALLLRRDGMTTMAREFYELLAGWVDIDATDEDEHVEVERLPSGDLAVRIFDLRDGEPRPLPWFERVFSSPETREVRIYLRGGDDDLTVVGTGPHPIELRVIGGGGDDRMSDLTTGRGVHFYDHRGDNDLQPAGGTHVDRIDYDAPEDPASEEHGARSRDWGERWIPIPNISYSPSAGLIVGVGASRTGYGFRHYPWENRLNLTVSVGLGSGRVQGGLDYDFPVYRDVLRNRTGLVIETAASRRFYGYGNDTQEQVDDDFYKADRTTITLHSDFYLRAGENTAVRFGPIFEATRPHDGEGTLIGDRLPYGYSHFEQAGLRVGVEYDTRDNLVQPTAGVLISTSLSGYPALLDVTDEFAVAEGRVRGYVGFEGALEPTLALRAGGRLTLGPTPFQSAAYVGGQETLRGYRSDRFAGDAMAFGGAEMRIRLGDVFFFLPADIGLFGLADAGRVFLHDTAADDGSTDFVPRMSSAAGALLSRDVVHGSRGGSGWHHALGGGIWINWMDFTSASLAVAHSSESTSLYLTVGMQF